MAESVMLTPEEQRWIKPLFDQYDLEDSNIVMGERIRPLLEKTALPPQQLSQIWQIVDTDNRGFLDFDGFAKILRLAYHSQHGLPLSPRLANIPAGLPDFNRGPYHPEKASSTSPAHTHALPTNTLPTNTSTLPTSPQLPSQPLAAFSTGGSTFSANGETRIPPLTTLDKKRYGSLFDRSVGPEGDGFIDGMQARDIFLKARLPQETLGKVWSLIDVEARGRLTKNEFVVAMHLIQALITKAMSNLPSALPASWQPWLGSPAFQQSQQHGRKGSAVSATSPPPPPPPSSSVAAASSARVATVSIAPKERAQFEAIFDSLDRNHSGILGPNEAVPVLTKSGLSEDVLAKVWDLADTRSRGQLDKGDFSLAMHFVKAKLNGQELPDHVSPGAGDASPVTAATAMSPQGTSQEPSRSRQGTMSPQGTSQNLPNAPAPRSASGQSGSQPVPHIPHRSATQVTASSGGSLSDLVSLDNAVFKPLEPAKPRRAATESDATKFVPTTSFGQQLLQQQNQKANKTAEPASSVQQVQSHPHAQPQPQPQSQSQLQQQQQQQNNTVPGFPQATGFQGQQKNAMQLESQISATKAQQARANEELATVLKEKADLENKLKDLRVTYDSGTKEVHETQQKIKAAREDIKQLERDIALRTSGLDAIKTQHAEEKKTLDSLLAQKTKLEEQHASHDKELKDLNTEIGTFKEQHASHRQEIEQHELRVTALQGDIQAARWQRQQLENEIAQHRQRAQQAREAAEGLERQAREETEAAAKAQADAKEAAELAEKHIRDAPAAPRYPTLSTTTADGSETHGLTPNVARSLSIGSGTDSATESVLRNAGVDTPRTSPPTSEAHYANIVEPNMPTFTLPMQRPHSTSSSVLNNPPQSIRGDLGSEPSERPTPEFVPMAMPDADGSPLDLAREASFEFVDAQSPGDDLAARADLESSDDDDGPDGAIPHKYGERSPLPGHTKSASEREDREPIPPMPGAFPTEGSSPEEIYAPSGNEQPQPVPQLSHSAPEQLPQYTSQQQQKQPQQPQQPASQTDSQRPSQSSQTLRQDFHQLSIDSQRQIPHDQAAAVPAFIPGSSAPVNLTGTQPISQARTPTAAVEDEFDAFDDLEEAKEDEAEDDSALFQTAHQTESGPDEWQQLFARNNGSVVSIASQRHGNPMPFSQPMPAVAKTPQESRELAELTSMGFTVDEARAALDLHGHNLGEATNYLLDNMR